MRDHIPTAIMLTCALQLICIAGSGCTTVQKGAGAALSVAATVKPEYAAVIKQIRTIVDGGSSNPVEGFTYEIHYYYKGVEILPADLERREIFQRITKADSVTFVPAEGAAPAVDTPVQDDAALRKQIADILAAAGVPMEDEVAE